ncbi:MAG: hypothetical protein H6Q15_2099 [Bacteroidetes bacterium]|nr:hypothetical protein [Bacteroidota bacterium]
MIFIEDTDFEVQVREEILAMLGVEDLNNSTAIITAEQMAISQIKENIGGRYDTDAIFASTGLDRNFYIVMITIDIMLYHLWSKKAPKRIPETRETRYGDALDWLKPVGKGTLSCTLPQKNIEDYTGDIIIESLYKPTNNKY